MFFNALQDGGVYDRTYNAEDFSSYLDKIVGNGVFSNPSTNLQVVAGSGMSITVKAGQGWIDGHKMILTADMPLTLSNSDVLLDRIDRVVFYCDYSNREMGIKIKEGTPDSPALYPTLIRDGELEEYCLANISIPAQSTSITQSLITDTRADSQICGYVTGLIDQLDTSTLFTQWQTAYQTFYNDIQQQLEDFMQTLTSELRVNTYIKQYTKSVQLTQSSSKIVSLDMNGYTYEDSDVIFVIINGLVGTPVDDYLIDTSQNPPEVHLNLVGSTNMTESIDIRVLKSVIGIEQSVNNS